MMLTPSWSVDLSGDEEIEEVTDTEDPDRHDRAEDRDEWPADDAAQDDELGQADGGDRHHEREGRAERHALAEEGLDDWDRAGGIRVERDGDQHDDRHGERVGSTADGGHELRRGVAVDEGPDADADQQVGHDPSNEVLRG